MWHTLPVAVQWGDRGEFPLFFPHHNRERTSVPDRLIVYVDGFNLYHGLRDKARHRLLWLDLVELAKLLRPRSSLVKVHYFTAPVLDDPAAASRQSHYQQAMQALHPGIIKITQGRYQKKPLICRHCGNSRTLYEEKETDVNIATTMVEDAARGAADSALVVSADSDLSPAIHAVRRLQPSMFIAAAFPPSRYSAELKKWMPASFHIATAKLNAAQLPPLVTDAATGRTYERPPKWH